MSSRVSKRSGLLGALQDRMRLSAYKTRSLGTPQRSRSISYVLYDRARHHDLACHDCSLKRLRASQSRGQLLRLARALTGNIVSTYFSVGPKKVSASFLS